MSGVSLPNNTPVPNEIINGWMWKLRGSELKILLLITRKTLGWIEDPETGMRKEEDWLSWRQIKQKTGLGSRILSCGIDNLCAKYKLIQIRSSEGNILDTKEKRLIAGRRRLRLYYRLNLKTLEKTSSYFDKNSTATERKAVEKKTKNESTATERKAVTATESASALLPKVRTTKETLTKEIYIYAKDFLKKWNEINRTDYQSIKAIIKNLEFWLQDYSLDQIKQAVTALKGHHIWKDKLVKPEQLLRKKNPRGEDVDYIGEMLNYKSNKTPDDGYAI